MNLKGSFSMRLQLPGIICPKKLRVMAENTLKSAFGEDPCRRFGFAKSSVGNTRNVFSLQNKTIIFLNAEQGYKYVYNSIHLQKLSMLDISLRMKKDISSFDSLKYQEDYSEYHKKQFRNWSYIDKNFVLHQLRKAYLKIDSITPKVLPDTLYFIRTTGRQEFKSY